jgi:hypothetical protein
MNKLSDGGGQRCVIVKDFNVNVRSAGRSAVKIGFKEMCMKGWDQTRGVVSELYE